MRNRLFFLAVGIILFSTITLTAIDFSNITSTSITAFGSGNTTTFSGDILATKEFADAYGAIVGIPIPEWEGVSLTAGQNEAQYGFGLGATFNLEFDDALTISTGLEYEETKVKFGEFIALYLDGTHPFPIAHGLSEYEFSTFGVDRTHKTLALPIHAAYKIAPLSWLNIYLGGGVNLVYYLEGNETHKYSESLIDPVYGQTHPDDTYALANASGLIEGLPLDVGLVGNLNLGFPLNVVNGEILLGMEYIYYFNSPTYSVTDSSASEDVAMRDYSMIFSPFKLVLGYKFYLSKSDGTAGESSKRTSRTASGSSTSRRRATTTTKSTSSSRGEQRTVERSFAW